MRPAARVRPSLDGDASELHPPGQVEHCGGGRLRCDRIDDEVQPSAGPLDASAPGQLDRSDVATRNGEHAVDVRERRGRWAEPLPYRASGERDRRTCDATGAH